MLQQNNQINQVYQLVFCVAYSCYDTLFQEDKPFLFFVKDVEITNSLKDALDIKSLNSEEVVEIIYQQQAVFRVRPVTRCTRSVLQIFINFTTN